MRYLVIYEGNDHDGDGWSAYAPDLPGCVAAGASREEVRSLMREAMEAHLQLMHEDGDDLPRPGETWTEWVDVDMPALPV